MISRSRTDIIEDMLQVAEPGVIKTRMMHRAFLSFSQLKTYLELLIDSGLLEYSEEEKLYRTTEKGRYFLKTYKEMKQTISPKEEKVIVDYN